MDINYQNSQPNKVKSKKGLIIFILILVLIIVGIYFFVVQSREANKYSNDYIKLAEEGLLPEVNNEGINTEVNQIEPEERKVIEKEAEDVCIDKNNDNSLCANAFYRQQAINEKDEKYCEMLESDIEKRACFDNLYTVIATGEEPEVAPCEKLSDENKKIACTNEAYFNMAYKDQDNAEEYCNKITLDKLKDLCLEQFVK